MNCRQAEIERQGTVDVETPWKRLLEKSCLVASMCAVCLLWSANVTGEVYKWFDENGKIHYTDTPPDQSAKPLDLPTGPNKAVLQNSRKEADRLLTLDRRKEQIRQHNKARAAQEAETRRKEAKARKRYCTQAENDLKNLKLQVRVFWTNERGERVFITDHERPQRIAELERIVQRDCQR